MFKFVFILLLLINVAFGYATTPCECILRGRCVKREYCDEIPVHSDEEFGRYAGFKY